MWRSLRRTLLDGCESAHALEARLVVPGCLEVGEHLLSWAPNAIPLAASLLVNFHQLLPERAGLFLLDFIAEDRIVIRDEEADERRWQVERWREDDTNVADVHLVHVRCFDNFDEESRQGLDQGEIGERKAMDAEVQRCDLALLVFEV